MRMSWYGDGQVLRVPLTLMPPSEGETTRGALYGFAAGIGFPNLLDWSRHVDEGEGVLVFGPRDGDSPPPTPGRDDLDAEAVVLWVRKNEVSALLFAKTIGDLAAVLTMIATYEQALEQISAHGERVMQSRAQQAQDAQALLPHEPRMIITPVAETLELRGKEARSHHVE